jgi:hypothetical protein
MWQKMFLSEHLQRLRFKIGLSFIHVTHDKREEKNNFFMYSLLDLLKTPNKCSGTSPSVVLEPFVKKYFSIIWPVS